MHGPPHLVVAAIGIPGAWQCLAVAAPFLFLAAVRWIVLRVDHAVDRLFPGWEWEKRLAWLNLRAQRRADAILRWIGYFVYALLAAALYGIVWAVPTLENFDRWNDPGVLGEICLRLPVLFLCLVFWLTYLGLELLPKLRRQYEADELEKFRAERTEIERDDARSPGSRLTPPPHLEKPRANPVARPERRFGRN
jgi:hypothetical protein